MKTSHFEGSIDIGQPGLLLGAMNELKVNLQHSILTLAGNGWSNRRIARELGINRETVGKYLLLARPKPAISTPGSEPDPNSKPAISTAGSTAGRQSLCHPHSPQIEAAVEVGLSKGVGSEWPLVKSSKIAWSAFPVTVAVGDFDKTMTWPVE